MRRLALCRILQGGGELPLAFLEEKLYAHAQDQAPRRSAGTIVGEFKCTGCGDIVIATVAAMNAGCLPACDCNPGARVATTTKLDEPR